MELIHEYTHDISHRFKYLTWIVIAVFIIIIGRLYYLQIIKGDYYQFFSEQNSMKDNKIPALRGTIYDKNGVPLVENRAAFDAVIIPQYIIDRPKAITSIASILSIDPAEIDTLFQKAKGMPSYQPVLIKDDINEEEVAAIRAYKTPWYDNSDPIDLRGVEVQMRYARNYPDSLAYSHLLGYLKEIDAVKLKTFNDKKYGNYKMGNVVGIGGIEEAWDLQLRGSDGFDQIIVNAVGREVVWPGMDLIHEEPLDGADLKLTIDADLQIIAKNEFADKNGAAVAIDPNTGGVLLLYSSPSIDLNRLSSPEGHIYWQQIVTDSEKPIYNRSIQGIYPPGSTFKIVTATSALSEKVITPNSTLGCSGGLNFGGRFYSCWRKGGHGSISVRNALTSSCDTFFYQMGLKLGPDNIAKYANAMGLGLITGIDVPSEKTGLIPTTKWKEETKKVKWQAGENLSIAVGQGYVSVTPLQNAVMIATIANGGKKVVPHIAESLTDPNGNMVYQWRANSSEQVLTPEVVKVVKEGLEGVVESPEGTAHRLKALNLKIAGKTGTAQVIGKEQWRGGVEKLKDHAWFVGYAPYDNPKIAVAVVVEHGGFGASAAAPIVGQIIKKYLEKEGYGPIN